VIFVDTSAFYAIHDETDPVHDLARRTWAGVLQKRAEIVTTNYVVVEASALIQRRLGIDVLKRFLSTLKPCHVHWIDEKGHAEGTDLLIAQNRPKLSLVDCTSIATMRNLGIEQAFAFDRHFAEFGFKVLQLPENPS